MKKTLLLPIFALAIALSSCAQETEKQEAMDVSENKMVNEKETIESSDTKTTDDENMDDSIIVKFRVNNVYPSRKIAVYTDDKCIIERKKRVLAPGEMELLRLKKDDIDPNTKKVTIQLEEV